MADFLVEALQVIMNHGDAYTAAARVANHLSGSMEPRSIAIVLINNSDQQLIWDDSGLDHGKRSITAPDFINPRTHGHWMLESDGFLTGCEGWMHWKVGQDGPMLKVNYDNPYDGGNEYNCWVHPQENTLYKVEKTGGRGNKATIAFTFSNR
ncbi:crystal et79 [Cladorrhinum sp. PSN259]|nr:crystal et79 [Cladorrhinum sp. PSN259]